MKRLKFEICATEYFMFYASTVGLNDLGFIFESICFVNEMHRECQNNNLSINISQDWRNKNKKVFVFYGSYTYTYTTRVKIDSIVQLAEMEYIWYITENTTEQ